MFRFNEENKTLAASSLDCVRSCMPCLYVFVFVERHSRVQEKRSTARDLILELLLVLELLLESEDPGAKILDLLLASSLIARFGVHVTHDTFLGDKNRYDV